MGDPPTRVFPFLTMLRWRKRRLLILRLWRSREEPALPADASSPVSPRKRRELWRVCGPAHAQTRVHTLTHTGIGCQHTRMHTLAHTGTCVPTYTCTCPHAQTCAPAHVLTHRHMHQHTRVQTCTPTGMCARTKAHTCARSQGLLKIFQKSPWSTACKQRLLTVRALPAESSGALK